MWEVIGYEKNFVDNGSGGYEAYNLYLKKPLNPDQNCEGCKCKTVWYRAHEIPYVPALGDQVFVETEQRGKFNVTVDIIRV